MSRKILIVDLNNIWMKTLYVCNYTPIEHLSYLINYVRSIYKNKQYDEIILVIDGTNSKGKALLKQYKAGRIKRDGTFEHLKVFVSIVSQYVKVLRNKETEGDIITAKLAMQFKAKGDEVTIFSNDKDFLQLAQFGIKISDKIQQGRAVELTEDEILAKFKNSKKEPLDKITNILKYRVFKGDSSDKIPSPVRGLKDTYIRQIINVWEGNELDENKLDLIIDKIEDDKLKCKLEENKDNILRNYKLMDLIHIEDEVLKNLKKLKNEVRMEDIKKWQVKDWQVKW